jgi:hypothetical protein
MNGGFTAPPEVARAQRLTLIIGAVFSVLFVASAFIQRDEFFHAYLIGYLFWTGIALGSLALLMLQHLTGGRWGLVIRRVLEAATRTLPLNLLLFVPIVAGARHIYPWTHPEEMQGEVLQLKARYLNLPFFTGRAALYFAIWLLLAYFLNAWSLAQDRSPERRLVKNMRVLSGPGLVLFVITVTFASIDWGMSLNPEWSSTIYGLIYVGAWSMSALAFAIAMLSMLSSREPMSRVVTASQFHDLGKLLLALVMLWAYFAFSQFLIIWSGNLPEEIHWYLPRTKGAWAAIAQFVVVFHFGLPFLLLLSRGLKRDPRKLVTIALLILLMRYVDLFWMIGPEFSHNGFHISAQDFIAPIAIGGLWLATFFWQLGRRVLVPVNDPEFEALITHEAIHGEPAAAGGEL